MQNGKISPTWQTEKTSQTSKLFFAQINTITQGKCITVISQAYKKGIDLSVSSLPVSFRSLPYSPSHKTGLFFFSQFIT
jgi:hypothetical protein